MSTNEGNLENEEDLINEYGLKNEVDLKHKGDIKMTVTQAGIVPKCRLAFTTFKGTRGLLRSASFTKPNHTYPTKPNLPKQTYQTKSNLAFQAY